jgi:hypothetical protein
MADVEAFAKAVDKRDADTAYKLLADAGDACQTLQFVKQAQKHNWFLMYRRDLNKSTDEETLTVRQSGHDIASVTNKPSCK